MFNWISPYIALRYSRAKQTTSFVSFINRMSVAGIALGLMALITVVSIMNGFEAQLKQRVLGVVPHLVVSSDTDLDIQSHDKVEAVMPFEEVDAVIQSRSALRGIQIQGIEPNVMAQYSVFNDNLLFGSLDLKPGSFEVIIGRSLAVQMDINPGDEVRVIIAGKSIYTPFGRVPSRRLVKVVGFFDLSSQADDTAILMHWKDVKKLKRKSGDSASSLRLFLYDAFQYDVVADWLNDNNLESSSWRGRQGTLFDAVKMEKNLMFIMLLLIIAVAAFNIISSLVMVVTEKQPDIAILQTQGMQGSSIMGIFVFNGIFNGIKGTFFGAVLGFALVYTLNPILKAVGVSLALSIDGNVVPFVVDGIQIASVIGFSILLCLLASLYPAYRAMKVKPANVLHNS
ncbi:lipoprotein-releasing ABC transporter permease subunit [Alteromonas sp. 5E99-2]|uniref:lipoprotein-releasing ABC transporter permease subunit n=1 Tax=Alteromonas sp. 5E99-2 TaxID=2817683 RepID=UPI001A99FF70|nr:lipoprotein-releasing ABC transporter permease subunit [Alteromonas sp. 5E99-2]MBO1254922.1 lipoprotein-releasing ABC transporter permease subunit [Alteromonas sp. 5E99-2]